MFDLNILFNTMPCILVFVNTRTKRTLISFYLKSKAIDLNTLLVYIVQPYYLVLTQAKDIRHPFALSYAYTNIHSSVLYLYLTIVLHTIHMRTHYTLTLKKNHTMKLEDFKWQYALRQVHLSFFFFF